MVILISVTGDYYSIKAIVHRQQRENPLDQLLAGNPAGEGFIWGGEILTNEHARLVKELRFPRNRF